MKQGMSDRIRTWARQKYVDAARSTGQKEFSIAVRDICMDLKDKGLPLRNTPQVCNALQSTKFLRENELEITSVDGPPSRQSTTVVVHYRMLNTQIGLQASLQNGASGWPTEETPEEWSFRLTEKLRGLFKEELEEFGGAEGFMRWVRSDEPEKSDEAAA